MSVFKIKTAAGTGTRWVAQVWRNGECFRAYSDPLTGKAINKKSRAREIELELMAQKTKVEAQTCSKHSVASLREAFTVQLKKRMKPTSVYARVHYFDNEIVSYFGDKAIEDVTNDDLERFNDRINARMTPGQLNNTVNTMRVFLKFARKWNPTLLPENIFKFKNSSPNDHAYHFYTIEQEKKLLSAIKDPNDKLLFTLFCYYGFRITECLALKRSDIDTRRKTISVRRIVQTKTEKSGQSS